MIKVERRGATAVHYALGEATPGSEVDIKIDWERRFDHMQQHTGMGKQNGGKNCIMYTYFLLNSLL